MLSARREQEGGVGTPSPQTPLGLNACTPPLQSPHPGARLAGRGQTAPLSEGPQGAISRSDLVVGTVDLDFLGPQAPDSAEGGQDALPGCSHQHPRECCAAFLLGLGRSPLVDENGNCGWVGAPWWTNIGIARVGW